MSEYNFDLKIQTKNFTIQIDTEAKYGYFEHDRLGDECGGGLWFSDDKELEDYDGVFALKHEVSEALIAHGYIVGQDCVED